MSLRSWSTLSPQYSVRSSPALPCAAKQQIAFFGSPCSWSSKRRSNVALSRRRVHCGVVVRSSLETVGPTVGKVTEVNKDTFWPIVNGAGDKAVVLDMYTQWYIHIHTHTYIAQLLWVFFCAFLAPENINGKVLFFFLRVLGSLVSRRKLKCYLALEFRENCLRKLFDW